MKITRAQFKRIVQEELGRFLKEADVSDPDREESWAAQASRTGDRPVMGREAPQERGPGTMGLPQRGTNVRPPISHTGVTGEISLPPPPAEHDQPSLEGGYTPDPEGGFSPVSPERLQAFDRGVAKGQGTEAGSGAAGIAQQAAGRPSRGSRYTDQQRSDMRAARRDPAVIAAAEERGVSPRAYARRMTRGAEGYADPRQAADPRVSATVAPGSIERRPQRMPDMSGHDERGRPPASRTAPGGMEASPRYQAGFGRGRREGEITPPLRGPSGRPDRSTGQDADLLALMDRRAGVSAVDESVQRKGTPSLKEMVDRLAAWSRDEK